MKTHTILCVWTMLVGLMIAVAAACSKLPAPEAPAGVDEDAYCYAAVVEGKETVGCAETPELCESARAAAALKADASAQCWPVRLRLDRKPAADAEP